MNTNQGNNHYQVTIFDKKRLRQQIDLYSAYLSKYGLKEIKIDAIKVGQLYDTLRITTNSLRDV